MKRETNFEDNSTKGYKVRLYPNKKQRKLLFEYFEMSKFVYNKCIDMQEEQYIKYILDDNDNKKRLSYEALTGIFTNMKKEDKYKWLNYYSTDSIRGSIRDCCKAYSNYDNNIKYGKPTFKNYKSKKQFYTRPNRMVITNDYIKLSKFGNIKYCNSYGNEILGDGNKDKKKYYL